MNYKHIITTLALAFTLTLTACAGGGGGGSSSGSNEPAPTVVRANTYNAQGEVTGYKVTTINSDLNPIAETYYDNDGQPLSTIEYTYDGPRLTGRIRRNAAGEIIERTSISYADTTRRSNRYASNGTLLSFTLTTTNERGQITLEEAYDRGGNLIRNTTYIYDGNGFRTEQRNFDADGKLTTYTRYRYHPDGTLRSEHTYDAEGLLVDYTTYTYGRGDATSLANPKDTDGDGREDEEDNCPTIANRDQANTYGGLDDKEGDACDDTDNDDVYDLTDNCPTTPNNKQRDSDGDGTGDACDEHHTRPGENVTFNDISRLEHLLSVAGKTGYARLTAHIEITPEVLRAYTGSAEWTPLPHYGVLDGNGYTIRGLNHQALFSTIEASARVTNLGILGGIMAVANRGTISNSYATGDSIGSGIRGGLVRLNYGIIRNSYALGNSATTTPGNVAGGLVGSNIDDGLITNSYATGNATSGGLTGDKYGSARNSYAVHPTTNTLGDQRTIEQLQCPTRPGDPACRPPTYIGWNSTVWDFGRDNELPILRGFVLCPRGVSFNCHRYRAAGDADKDGVANLIDNCLTTPNPHQYNNDSDRDGDACDTDDDGDGHLDAADNCPLIANADQDNTDSILEPDDGINGITILGDACDPDDDGDYINDDEDNCQYIRNFLQVNTDGDALGDKCDPDDDNDFRLDTADNCPHIRNTDQANADGDALGDACDPDLDGDGHNNSLPGTDIAVINPTDNCPTVANPDQTDTDLLFRIRLGLEPKSDGGDACDDDDDEDGRLDISDNCPTIYNPDQKDTDLRLRIRLDLEPKIDGGDACDYDLDGDGHNNTLSYTDVPGATDNCPRVWNEDQANTDNDALGDVCDPDRDGDGHNNTLPDIPDIIVLEAKDNCPYIANPQQTNTDSDELGDACDPDLDGDGHNNILSYIDVPNANDNCPTISNPQQTNTDGDALGDACDPDRDGDGYNNTLPGTGISVINPTDNCPTISNPDQANLDNQTERGIIGIDILGDACDPDIDGDGDLNAADNCPTIVNPDQKDTDLRRRILLGLEPKVDGGDACDHDLDEDGHNNSLPGTGILVINPTDNCPTIFNRDQANADNDALGDACDPDRDGDGHNNTLTGTGILVINPTDNCPSIPNPDQSNTITPGNAKGDACDDPDRDGIYDISDNCPTIANPKQANLDRDATGDTCDPLTPITNTTTLQAITIGNYQITTHLAVPGPWTPIRNFRGTFNGGNHTISGLTGPLFHTIGARATVTAIGIVGSTLAYTNHGTITNSYATGDSNTSRTGTIRSGGLVDHNTGLITTSYAAGNIGCDTTGTCFIGGLVGANGGTITNSYATGDITCPANNNACTPGGLVSILDGSSSGTITNSYATGTIRGGGGGLVGFIISGPSGSLPEIRASYRLDRARADNNDVSLHRTLAQLQCPTSPGATCQGSTTYSGWDDSIWDFGTEQDLPELRGLDRDRDNDGINDNADNCPFIPNAQYQDRSYATCQDITSAADLINNLIADATGYYRLTTNITISTNWTPITNFRGTFNGGNHTITFHAAQPNPPLFDTINSTATVTNIGILNSILAHTNHGNISYAYATGSSSSDGSRSNSGGLVDYNTGTITHSYATGDSTCTGSSCRSGGLVGRNTGTITNSYATGNSTCTGSSCNSGGLVGRNTGTITLSYAIGDSNGEISGGLVGRNTGAITNSYATGASTGSSGNTARNGGLVGSNAGIITNSYAAGDSSIGTGLSGGLVGRNFRGTITNSYRVQPSGTNTFAIHRTLAQLRCPTAPGDTCQGNTTYSSWSSNIWNFGTSDDLPTLVNLPPCPPDNPNCRHRITFIDDDGDGIHNKRDNCPTISNPDQRNTITPGNAEGDACDDPDTDGIYDISDNCPIDYNPTQANLDGDAKGDACDESTPITNTTTLQAITTGNYQITTNLSVSGPWTPISNFHGNLNGNNHTIRGLPGPLFNTISANAAVTDIGIIGGTLARTSHGNISYAYATGNSRCSGLLCYSGGLVGHNTGIITHSYATGNSTCTGSFCRSGGLVGRNDGTIRHSYATGDNSCSGYGYQYSGGLVGHNFEGHIINSYATGNSKCNGVWCSSGGLVGQNAGLEYAQSGARNSRGSTVMHSYATGTGTCSGRGCVRGGLIGVDYGTTRSSYSFQGGGTNVYGRPHRTMAQLRCPTRPGENCLGATTYIGWDSAIWDFGSRHALPILRGLPAPDRDGDGTGDHVDNCPTIPNPHQYNNDTDALGDACDTDDDNDGHPDTSDDFPIDPTEHTDSDNDGTGDNGDAFPTDPTEDTDTDNDGIGDNADSCRLIPNAQYQDRSYTTCQDITSAADLMNNLTTDPSGYYRLTANITLSAGTTWTPVTNFNGTLNGENHTILFRNGTQPLFHTINSMATVTNIGILNSTLARINHGKISYAYATGNSVCSERTCSNGGLVGYNTGTITNAYATGDSACTGSRCYSGGLVGYNTGTITNSYATGNSRGVYNGGLVGWNTGTITNSYATGDSICSSFGCHSGGLVGRNYRGTITNSYATGNSHGSSRSGGLVGHNDNGGTITHSYATGNSSSDFFNSGGLVGYNNGRITNSYATGNSHSRSRSQTRYSGGLVGSNDNAGHITNSYATGDSTCPIGYCYSGGLIGSNNGRVTNSYATGYSACTGSNCDSGGLVGSHGRRGIITNSYATGYSACTGSNCRSSGLVGRNYRGTITDSYRVQPSGTNTFGDHRTLAQLRCPTAPGDTCQGNTTYSGWNSNIWNFSTSDDLPILVNPPSCPADNPNCRHRITLSDNDNDGIEDINDNCPTTANRDQADLDGDTTGDACDTDKDGDGYPDISDAFPRNATEHQDSDSDRIGDNADNCPTNNNPQQTNRDGDDYGDVCDAFPNDPTEDTDTDNDGIGDNADSCRLIPNAQYQDRSYTTCQDITSAAALMNNLTADASGYYRLTTNITLSADTTWTPITNFNGTFNGENHTITFHATQPNLPLFDIIKRLCDRHQHRNPQ